MAEVEALPERDVAYLSQLMEKIYAGEIDRKDKILRSMVILAAPTTLVVGGIAYLINTLIDQLDSYLRGWQEGVFRNLFRAIALAALSFVLIAVHREAPQSVSISQLWTFAHAIFE